MIYANNSVQSGAILLSPPPVQCGFAAVPFGILNLHHENKPNFNCCIPNRWTTCFFFFIKNSAIFVGNCGSKAVPFPIRTAGTETDQIESAGFHINGWNDSTRTVSMRVNEWFINRIHSKSEFEMSWTDWCWRYYYFFFFEKKNQFSCLSTISLDVLPLLWFRDCM